MRREKALKRILGALLLLLLWPPPATAANTPSPGATTSAGPASSFYEEARRHWAAGEEETAFHWLEKTLQVAPESPEALYLMGLYYLRRRMFPETLEQVRTLVNQGGNHLETAEHLLSQVETAWAREKEAMRERTAEVAETITEVQKSVDEVTPLLLFLQGVKLSVRGNLQEAFPYYEQAVRQAVNEEQGRDFADGYLEIVRRIYRELTLGEPLPAGYLHATRRVCNFIREVKPGSQLAEEAVALLEKISPDK